MKTLSLYLIVIIALTSALFAQEIPNGDGDLLWERNLGGRFVNDANFHPINGNIIAAVNHEIWEIDPKDGHTIRVFEGGPATGQDDQFEGLQITTDGRTILTDGGSGIEGLLIWDYETGKIRKVFDKGGPNRGSLGIFPDDKRAIFFTFKLQGIADRQIVIYNFETDQIEKQISIAPYAAEKLALSKDGRYLAIGRTYNNNGNWNYSMELWDAETLKKIKDFGEAGDIVEFRDVQISDDNQYVGFLCGGPRIMYLFNSNISQLIKKFDNTSAFSFTPNSKIIVYTGTKPEDAQSNILSLPKFDTVYQYIWARSLFRFNEKNEMYTGNKMYSNNWYVVGVKPNLESKTQVKFENDKLIFTLPKEVIPQKISIMNLLGEIIYETCELTELNDKIVLELPLPTGIYLISLNDGKSKLFGKFVVVR